MIVQPSLVDRSIRTAPSLVGGGRLRCGGWDLVWLYACPAAARATPPCVATKAGLKLPPQAAHTEGIVRLALLGLDPPPRGSLMTVPRPLRTASRHGPPGFPQH